jgi:hypothetical protein
MLPLTSVAGGFLATLGLLSLAVSGPASVEVIASVLTSPPQTYAGQQVDRSRKGDRLASNASLGQRPGDKSNDTTQNIPVKTLKEDKGQRLIGCDPLVSPLAGSSLSQVAGRCIAGLPGNQKVAMVMR